MQPSEGVLEKDEPVAAQLAPAPAPSSPFHLVRYFTLTSLVAFVIVAAVLGTAFRAISVGSLLESQQATNVNITRILSNQLWANDFGPFVKRMTGRPAAQLKAAPEVPRLHAKVLALMRGSDTFKVKVYAPDGMTLYSTELAQIGEDKRANKGVIEGLKGRTTSELVHRNTFSALEQQVLARDLIQSYIPAYEEGRIAGVFEVYSDVTPYLEDIKRDQWMLVGAVIGLLAALYAALFVIVNIAQGIIRRQSQARYREFLAAAAHELRTPVTSIYGFTDLLKTRTFERAVVQDVVSTLHQQAEHLVRLLNDLLDLSRIEAREALAFDFQRQALAPIVESALAQACPPGAARETKVEIEPGLPALRVDRLKLRQALVNVLSNAYKFSPAHAPVALSAFRAGSRVGIRVADRGIGMSQADLGRLFERFWRAQSAAEIPGSGLGMALTQEIVRFHGGTIEVASAPGEGTQVTLWLPC